MDLVKKVILSQKHSVNALSTSIYTSPTERSSQPRAIQPGAISINPHTQTLKTLSASSVVPYLTTDNEKFRVSAPWKRMQGQTSNLTLRKMSATSHTTANFVHKCYISAKIRSIFL